MTHRHDFIGMISADWNQCLAPCGPFDSIVFRYPQLQRELDDIFQRYTANEIPLASAVQRIQTRLPAPLSDKDMDAYLTNHFKTYRGVADLMLWCERNHILFMINTTGPMGYFQRVLVRDLMPKPAVISAHPVIRYSGFGQTEPLTYELLEITDKGINTSKAAAHFGIPHQKIIVIGDSGGDGPHFEWACSVGATTITSMAKPSLINYCSQRGLEITHRFGHTYADGQSMVFENENRYDFMQLSKMIRRVLGS